MSVSTIPRVISPVPAEDEYFKDPTRHALDAGFKAERFLYLMRRSLPSGLTDITSYVDVGAGSGKATRLIAEGLRAAGYNLRSAKGYDVSPHIRRVVGDGVEYLHADFTRSNEVADLVTVFDVVEHVPDPIGFLKAVAERARIVAVHLPLDNSINVAFRDLFRGKVRNPGHLIFLTGVDALNLLAFAGLRVIDYEYTMSFMAPSGRSSLGARLINPFRRVLAAISPWLLSRTLGGTSLMMLALSPSGVRSLTPPSRHP